MTCCTSVRVIELRMHLFSLLVLRKCDWCKWALTVNIYIQRQPCPFRNTENIVSPTKFGVYG